jgi:hypothetical protein
VRGRRGLIDDCHELHLGLSLHTLEVREQAVAIRIEERHLDTRRVEGRFLRRDPVGRYHPDPQQVSIDILKCLKGHCVVRWNLKHHFIKMQVILQGLLYLSLNAKLELFSLLTDILDPPNLLLLCDQ